MDTRNELTAIFPKRKAIIKDYFKSYKKLLKSDHDTFLKLLLKRLYTLESQRPFRVYYMRLTILLIFFLIFNFCIAQVNGKEISISFTEVTIPQALSKIEEKTNYHFYYLGEWFGTDLISGNYKSMTVEAIIENILKKVEVNFYMFQDDMVILTKNTIIYDSLPEAFDRIHNRTPLILRSRA